MQSLSEIKTIFNISSGSSLSWQKVTANSWRANSIMLQYWQLTQYNVERPLCQRTWEIAICYDSGTFMVTVQLCLHQYSQQAEHITLHLKYKLTCNLLQTINILFEQISSLSSEEVCIKYPNTTVLVLITFPPFHIKKLNLKTKVYRNIIKIIRIYCH